MNIIYYSIYFLKMKCILGVKKANWILFPCYWFMVRSSRTIGNIERKRSYPSSERISYRSPTSSYWWVNVVFNYHQLFFRTIVFRYQVKHLFGAFHSLNTYISLFIVIVLVCQVTVEFISGCTHLNCFGL